MTDSLLFRAVFGLLGLGLMYVAMCRFRPMSSARTLARVRHAALGVFVAGLLMVGAVTTKPELMTWAVLSGPAAALGWMAATSHAWRYGQPLSAVRGGAVVRRWRWTAPHTRPTWQETRPMSDTERWRA